jgi:hypothetical protein
VAGAAAAAAVLIVVFLYALVGLPGPVPTAKEEIAVNGRERDVEIAKDTPPSPRLSSPRREQVAPVPDSGSDSVVEESPSGDGLSVPPRGEPVRRDAGRQPVAAARRAGAGRADEGEEKKPAPAVTPDKPLAVAKIGNLAGEFKVKRAGSEEWEEGSVLLSILPGDTVETNPLGQVRIDFAGGDCVYLNTNSLVDIAGSGRETLVKVRKGEVYCEKVSTECELAIDTGFGEVRAREGSFDVKMFGPNQCLLHVLSGEVKCCGSEKGESGQYGELTRAWLRRGKHCEKGTRLRSKEDFRWAMKLRPQKEAEDEEKHAGKPAKQDQPGKQDPGPPAPGVPPKPGDQQGQKPDDGQSGGKVGPGPSPMPPAPGGAGPGPGGGHQQGGNQGGVCPPGGKK